MVSLSAGDLLFENGGRWSLAGEAVGPISSFGPWTTWTRTDLHGFCKWVMDALALLREFVQEWANWVREDPSSHPFKWLRPDFAPPLPYLACNLRMRTSGNFCSDGHEKVTSQAFLDFVGDHLPKAGH